MPTTRLGEPWLFRKGFEEARNIIRKQNNWCESASQLSANEQLKSILCFLNFKI